MHPAHHHGAPPELDAAARHLYRLLVQGPGRSAEQLADAAGTSTRRCVQLLDELSRAQLAQDTGEGWEALRPPDVLESFAHEQRLALDALISQHRVLSQLDDLYVGQHGLRHYDGIELLPGPVQLVPAVNVMMENTQHLIRAFDRSPHYTTADPVAVQDQIEGEAQRVLSGVEHRVIYESALWEDGPRAAATLRAIENGENARIIDRLPMKMYLFDDDRAVVPLDPVRHRDGSSLIIHPSGLLQALSDIFELFWSMAVPFGTATAAALAGQPEPEGLSERERVLVGMLAAGASDSRILRQLGVSRSTLTRSLAELCERLHVDSRFQLGAECARRGWI